MNNDEPEVVLDGSYIHREGSNPLPPDNFPFFGPEGHVNLPCFPSKYFTGLVSEMSNDDGTDHKAYGIVAMAGPKGGLFATFTPNELREMAKQFEGMANDIERFDAENEEKNGGRAN